MNNYVVTNIRLPEEDYLRLKEEAAKKRKSLSAIIRDKVSEKKLSGEEYAKKLLHLKTDWFSDNDYQDYKSVKAEVEKKLKKYNR